MHCPSTRGCRRDRACEVTRDRDRACEVTRDRDRACEVTRDRDRACEVTRRRRGGVMTVVGIGMVPGVTADEVLAAVDAVLPAGRLDVRPDVRPDVRLATLDTRADEPGLVEAAARRGWRVDAYPSSVLAAVRVPSPSSRVAELVGTPSVAEAAALVDGGTLTVVKTAHGRVTVAVAE